MSDLNAIKTVLEFLNMLRCVTEYKFSRSKHKINRTQIPGRNYDLKKGFVNMDNPKQAYNDLPPSPLFNGRPYGIVLDIQNTEVSSSFIRLKDYTSSLYYAENYADNRLGGSGCAFELFSGQEILQSSLSGFGKKIDSTNDINDVERAIAFHDILKLCFTALGEEDNLKGLEEQTSRLRFESPEYFRDEGGVHGSQKLKNRDFDEKALINADTNSQIYAGRGVPFAHKHIAVVSSLSELGLRDTARHYLAGFSVNNAALSSCSELECGFIQEKWAEETWRMIQWDDTVLPKHIATATMWRERINSPLSFNNDLVRKAFKNSDHNNIKIGYHESLSNLFSSLLRDDESSFSTNLHQTRICLLEEFNSNVGTKTPNGLQSSHCLQFTTLNEIEDLGLVVFGKHSPNIFLQKWCSNSNIFKDSSRLGYQFNDIERAMACREIGLKTIFGKFGEHADDEIGQSYLHHLQTSCSFARQNGRPNVATAALERMRRFLELTRVDDNNNQTNQLTSLKISLEESRIIHCNGDATSAVRTCKLIISSLDKLVCDESEELAYLRGEALLQCGTWLIKHKIDAATFVLENFLSRAASQALQIYKNHDGPRSTRLLTSTHFVLAEFVANLYDCVEKRVNSQEWKSLGLAAEGRGKELKEVETMVKSFKNSPNKSQKVAQFNLRIEQSKLSKEVEMDTKERNAVEDSVGQYLRRAIRAYGTALSQCFGISNHSKHLFRLVSLWFRNCNGVGKGGDINSLIASEVTNKIPRYAVFMYSHFVSILLSKLCRFLSIAFTLFL